MGLRWEAQIEPDPITPASQVFFAGFIGRTSKGQRFPSDGNIPSDTSMWQPRLGITWDPTKDGKSVVRASFGLFNARVPGLTFASTRSTNGSLGQSLFRSSATGGVPAYPNLIPQSMVGLPDHPDVYVVDEDFRNPRTYAASIGVEREITRDWGVSLRYNWARTDHLTRFLDANDSLLGSPWSTGLGPDGRNGVGLLTTVTSGARSEYNGITLGVTRRFAGGFGLQANYTLSWDRSDDDNERDPFTFRYAKITDLGPEWGYSDRDQRHRFNGIFLWVAPGDVNVNVSYQYRSAQPQSTTATGDVANSPQDRVNADGSVTQRNLGRKDNQFSSLNLRVSRVFRVGELQVEPIVELFNIFNSKNLKKPEITNLVYNFDGTVQSGLGDPFQVQIGARLAF